MILWGLFIVAAIVGAPFASELLRKRMTAKVRQAAPGDFANLPMGTVHYQWFGPREGPVCVCVHGLTTSSYVWGGMVPALVDMGFRVLVYDHFGRGYSDHSTHRHDAAHYITTLDALLADQHVTSPVTLIGYSMGGAVVSAYAAERSARVHQAILLAPAGMQHAISPLMKFALRTPGLGDWMMHMIYPRMLRNGLRTEADFSTQVPGINNLQHRELTYCGFIPSVLASLRGLLRGPQEGAHRAIANSKLPILAIWGREDDVIPLSAMGILTTWNRACVQEVVEGASHALPYTHADEVTALICANLR